MKRGKREMPRKRNSKGLTALVAVALILCCSVGGTLAWLAATTGSVVNTFAPAKVSTEVEEKTGDFKSEVKIKNTSDIEVYVRAAILVNWVKQNGDGTVSVYAVPPVLGKDYTCAIGADWTLDADGYYYYNGKVAAGGSTTDLIVKADQTADANVPDGYQLQMTILSEAIQAEGMGATSAQDAWAKAAASKNS